MATGFLSQTLEVAQFNPFNCLLSPERTQFSSQEKKRKNLLLLKQTREGRPRFDCRTVFHSEKKTIMKSQKSIFNGAHKRTDWRRSIQKRKEMFRFYFSWNTRNPLERKEKEKRTRVVTYLNDDLVCLLPTYIISFSPLFDLLSAAI